MLNNKKGFITHPYTMMIVAFFVGMILMFLIAKGVMPLPAFLSWLKP